MMTKLHKILEKPLKVSFPEMTFEVVARLSTVVLSFFWSQWCPLRRDDALWADIICRDIGKRGVADNDTLDWVRHISARQPKI